MRKPQSYESHNTELRYIKRVSSPIIAESFNNDWNCFAEYCNMQARFADDVGFPAIAAAMRRIGDAVQTTEPDTGANRRAYEAFERENDEATRLNNCF